MAIAYTLGGAKQPASTLPGAFTCYPTTTSLPLTGSAAGLLIACAGIALTLLLCACALAGYRHHHYNR